MMARRSSQFLIFVLALLCLGWPVSQSWAEMRLSGSVGIDLTAYSFSSRYLGNLEAGSNQTNRSLSNHFVDARLTGTLINERFLAYGLRGKILGAFSQSSTGSASNNFYLSPALNSYYGSVLLFPERRYILRLFMGRQMDRLLEYEAKNRSETSYAQPSLSVVRRYRKESSRRGLVFDLKPTETISFSAQTSKSESQSLREYDFDEERDIWVDQTFYPPDPLTDVHTIEIINEIPDASVRVFVDGYDTTLAPMQFVHLSIDSGSQQVLIVPLTYYNQYEFTTRVEGEQIWKIEYREPMSPRDQKSEETGSRVQFDVGETGEKGLSAYYDKSNRFDPFSGQTTQRDLANNLMEYKLSESDRIKMESGYSRNQSIRNDEITQQNTTISHETSFEHRSRRGISGAIKHEFSRSKTMAGGLDLTSDINRVRSRFARPFRKLKYAIELESNVALKSDNTGVSSSQYDAGLTNRMETKFIGMTWRPMNMTRMTLRNRTRSDGSTNSTKIIESGFNLDGVSLRTTIIGDLAVKGTYSFRQQSDDVGSDSKALYGFDFLVSRKILTGLQVDLMTVHKWETFGGSTPVAGPNEDQATPAKPIEHKTTYRADVKMNPSDFLAMGVSYSLVSERISTISQFGIGVSATLPFLGIPLTSSYSKSDREIGDLPPQSSTNLTTAAKYRYRQIEFGLEHTYSNEQLIAQSFSYYEILVTINRGFGR
jgi:hypothetical protein